MDKKNFNYSSRYGILLLKPDLIDSDKMTMANNILPVNKKLSRLNAACN